MERKAQMAEEKVVTVLHSTQKRQEDPLPPPPSPYFNSGPSLVH